MTGSSLWRRLLLVACSLAVAGCGIGYNQTLFVSTTNFGVNVDSKPPTAEISFARREAVIQPIFERGKQLPVTASFYADTTSLLPFSTGIGDLFAGGAAAQAVSKNDKTKTTSTDKPPPGVLCLSGAPTGRDGGPALPPDRQVRPFLFGADTVIGLKIAWSGLTAQYPDSFKLGYNRQELALAPISGSTDVADVCPTGTTYAVSMPSFLASIHSEVGSAAPNNSTFDVGQLFATGDAATALAADPGVKAEFMSAIKQHVAASSVYQTTYVKTDSTDAIQAWLYPDGQNMDRTRFNTLQDWLTNNTDTSLHMFA